MPIEPPPSGFVFPDPDTADERGRVTVGGDLEPGTLLAAYRSGLFPMRQSDGLMTWWSPHPRAILTVDGLRVSHSLRRSQRHLRTTVDAAFEDVVQGCADRRADEYHWITDQIREAYVGLHRLGWAHSVETWTLPEGDRPPELVGGLYGVAIGGFFGGESMFNRRPDASKVALAALVALLRDDGRDGAGRLIDVQWITPHMASLGAFEVARAEYAERLQRALALPLPPALHAGGR